MDTLTIAVLALGKLLCKWLTPPVGIIWGLPLLATNFRARGYGKAKKCFQTPMLHRMHRNRNCSAKPPSGAETP